MEELIGQARGVTAEGFTYYFPAAHGSGYPASYLRDFCYMVEAAAEFIPADHVGGTIDFFMSHITADGLCPERIGLKDGVRIIYVCHGPLPAVDSPLFLTKLMQAYLHHYPGTAITIEQFEKLRQTLSTVPRDEATGLVWIDPAQAHTGYGFMDTIAITGLNLFSSLLTLEAHRIMVALAERLNQEGAADHYREQSERIIRNLDELWSEDEGMYLAGSMDCRQLDIWGSIYACHLQAISDDRRQRIAERLWADRERCLYRGYLRHIFEPDYWQRLIVEEDYTEPGKFQNGAYWSTPSGWLAELWESWRPGTGLQLLEELVDDFRENSVWECIHPSGYTRLENNLSSIVLPYRSLKHLQKGS